LLTKFVYPWLRVLWHEFHLQIIKKGKKFWDVKEIFPEKGGKQKFKGLALVVFTISLLSDADMEF